jgi:hypothetical protein
VPRVLVESLPESLDTVDVPDHVTRWLSGGIVPACRLSLVESCGNSTTSPTRATRASPHRASMRPRPSSNQTPPTSLRTIIPHLPCRPER